MYVRTYQNKVMDFFAAVSVEWWGAGQKHVRNYTLIIHNIGNNFEVRDSSFESVLEFK
jgi:hypothetical protein